MMHMFEITPKNFNSTLENKSLIHSPHPKKVSGIRKNNHEIAQLQQADSRCQKLLEPFWCPHVIQKLEKTIPEEVTTISSI